MKINQLRSTWVKLTGSPETHALEARIFHITCLFTIILFSCSIFFNYFIGLYTVSLLLIPGVVAAFGVYYLSKAKYRHDLAVTIFCVLGNVLFIAFYFNNSGINGPGLIIYLLYFFLILSIVPKSQRIIWMAINTIIAFMLLGIQHDHPEFIPLKHHDATARYVDFAYVYFFTLLIVYFTVTSILDNYNKERLLAVKRAEELEHANQSKTKLFSILAHDLKSPLNSIQNFLEILLEFDVTEQERRTIKTSLLRETKYTKQMLVNLLSWSKSQMDGMKVKEVKLDLAETLDPTLLLQASIAEEKAILLHNRLGSNITLFADHDMLELVVRNLVNNAIKFTPSGGKITISAEIHGEDCWILIKDTGVGIKKSKHKDIFTLQSSSTFGTNNEKGVGLGLVLCKEFITVQQGKIWMESTVGTGTTFFISLRLFK